MLGLLKHLNRVSLYEFSSLSVIRILEMIMNVTLYHYIHMTDNQ